MLILVPVTLVLSLMYVVPGSAQLFLLGQLHNSAFAQVSSQNNNNNNSTGAINTTTTTSTGLASLVHPDVDSSPIAAVFAGQWIFDAVFDVLHPDTSDFWQNLVTLAIASILTLIAGAVAFGIVVGIFYGTVLFLPLKAAGGIVLQITYFHCVTACSAKCF